jgi:hypothetical protein
MMRRHELDPVSLTFGFAFAVLGLLFLVGQPDQALRLRWIWPLLLVVLGAGILLDVARGRTHTAHTPELETTPSDLAPEATRPEGEPEATRPEGEPEATRPDRDPRVAPGGPDAATAELGRDRAPEGAVDDRERPS